MGPRSLLHFSRVSNSRRADSRLKCSASFSQYSSSVIVSLCRRNCCELCPCSSESRLSSVLMLLKSVTPSVVCLLRKLESNAFNKQSAAKSASFCQYLESAMPRRILSISSSSYFACSNSHSNLYECFASVWKIASGVVSRSTARCLDCSRSNLLIMPFTSPDGTLDGGVLVVFLMRRAVDCETIF